MITLIKNADNTPKFMLGPHCNSILIFRLYVHSDNNTIIMVPHIFYTNISLKTPFWHSAIDNMYHNCTSIHNKLSFSRHIKPWYSFNNYIANTVTKT